MSNELRVYYQIMYINEDGDTVHSDGCTTRPDRKFYHNLLDELLDGLDKNKPENVQWAEDNKKGTYLDGPHVIISLCTVPHLKDTP